LINFVGIAVPLDQEVQDLTLIVDRTPEPAAFSSDDDRHLVQVPMIAGLRTSPREVPGDDRAELQEPAAHRLGRHIQTSLGEHLLDVTQAQREPGVQPDRAPEHAGRKAMTLE
jgi:hypothetical protein